LGEPIGFISAETDDALSSVKIDYGIGRAWWRRGYTSEALAVVIRFFFEQVGANRVYATHDPRNPNSGAVMRKCGMMYEGTLRQTRRRKGEYSDRVQYTILAEDYFSAVNNAPRKPTGISPIAVRPMTAADYDGVYALWTATHGMGLNTTDDSREGVAKYLKRNPATSFVAYEDGAERIIGAILAGHDGRRGFIYHTAVAVSERGRGIGSALLQHAMDAFEATGIVKAALVVFARNELGNRFWEKRGFTVRTDLAYRNRNITEPERIDT
jgi:RimJ/RimL family protein N-acetyltransferase